MKFERYTIKEKRFLTEDVFMVRLKPENGCPVLPFKPGQFVRIKNSHSPDPFVSKCFSISSSPHERGYMEFVIKKYGPWTKAFSELETGKSVMLAGPYGHFTWDENVKHAAFIAGGVGITPFLSMIKHISERKIRSSISLLYGNRTMKSIVYKEEIDRLFSNIQSGKVIHILSDEKRKKADFGYRGFITGDIIGREIDIRNGTTFFLCGPPVFVQNMKQILLHLKIEPEKIRNELFT